MRSIFHTLVGALTLLFVLTGCDEDPGVTLTSCRVDSECGANARCVEGLCVPDDADVGGDVSGPDGDTTPDAPSVCSDDCGTLSCCAGSCIDPSASVLHCGGCGQSCFDLPNIVAASCVEGRCAIDACASGFADCDNDLDNGCEITLDAEPNCGGCGVTCGSGERCEAGVCVCDNGTTVAVCNPGDVCCSGQCVAPDAPACSCTDCTASESCCSGTCTNTSTAPQHCGACGNACGPDSRCENGACVCLSGTLGDDQNCGTCGNACGSGLSCKGGACDCANGTLNDDANCGSCGNACPSGQSCKGGACDCTNGTLGDDANCGSCGNACGSSERCAGGACVCATGTLNDDANCGGCGNACPSGQSCVQSSGGSFSCAPVGCPSGQLDCNGTCVDGTSNVNNCGSCGNTCTSPGGNTDPVCFNGSCALVCSANYGNCDNWSGNGCEADLLDLDACGPNCRTRGDCRANRGDSCSTSGGVAHCLCDGARHCNPGESCELINGTDGCRCGGTVNYNGTACPTGNHCCVDTFGITRSCVDVDNDNQNCGGCGVQCPGGTSCVSGQCQ